MKKVQVKGFENLYEIDEDGNIYSIKRQLKMKIQWNNKIRYNIITLCKDGKHHTKSLHVLVLSSFTDKPSEFHEVNHKDGNRLNNKLQNLEWMTRSQNIQHSYDVLKRKPVDTKGMPQKKRINKNLPKGITMHYIRYRVRITNNPSSSGYKHLGVYDTLEEAMKIYQIAHIEKYGTNPYLDTIEKKE